MSTDPAIDDRYRVPALSRGLALLEAFSAERPALSLVDLWLYHRLSDSVVCYRCDTVYRDAVPTARQSEVDLLKHDVVKYGTTWQELPPEAAAETPEVDGTDTDDRALQTAAAPEL